MPKPTGKRFTHKGKAVGRAKSPAAVALGRKGGRVGGPARAKALPSAKRAAIASHAAKKRWGKSTSYSKPKFYQRKVR